MQPSVYQQAIFDFVENGKGNAVINAVAGSGKTTTILKSLDLIPKSKKVIFLAFNKSVAQELQSRVPEHVRVQTLHSFGWSAIKWHYKLPKDSKPESNKIYNILKTKISEDLMGISEMSKNEKYSFKKRVVQIVDLMRMELIKINSPIQQVEELLEKHEINPVGEEIQIAFKTLALANKSTREYDFTDMVYRPGSNIDNMSLFKFDFVFIDECQDLNRAQQSMVERMVKPITGRFIAVGDPRQAIYGFAGADSESFERLKTIQNTKEFPLSVCYRCAKSIVEKAKVIVPQIEAFEGKEEGYVLYESKDGITTNDIKNGDWVLCRNYKPLASLSFELISRGLTPKIIGSDYAESMKKAITATNQDFVSDIQNKLVSSLKKSVETLLKKGKSEKEILENERLLAKNEIIQVIQVLSSKAKNKEDLLQQIDNLFDVKSDDVVTLCTVHKSKGLESDIVFILRPDLLTSNREKKAWKVNQAKNLEYVAYTRAKSVLAILDQWKEKFVGSNILKQTLDEFKQEKEGVDNLTKN